MDLFGIVLMTLGLLAGFYAVISTGFFTPNSTWGKFCIAWAPYWVSVRLLDRRPRFGEQDPRWHDKALSKTPNTAPPPIEAPDPVETVGATRQGSILEIGGLGALQVDATALMLELQSFGTDKSDKRHIDPRSGEKLRVFKALTLGKRLLMEHPEAEGGRVKFFLYDEARTPRGFTGTLTGTRDNPGPAARFAQSDQTAEVTLDALDRTWRLQDIIWVDVDNESGRFFVRPDHRGKKARVAMLLCVNVSDEDEWLLFADLRSGQGSDTLWVGRQFDPGIEIEL